MLNHLPLDMQNGAMSWIGLQLIGYGLCLVPACWCFLLLAAVVGWVIVGTGIGGATRSKGNLD